MEFIDFKGKLPADVLERMVADEKANPPVEGKESIVYSVPQGEATTLLLLTPTKRTNYDARKYVVDKDGKLASDRLYGGVCRTEFEALELCSKVLEESASPNASFRIESVLQEAQKAHGSRTL